MAVAILKHKCALAICLEITFSSFPSGDIRLNEFRNIRSKPNKQQRSANVKQRVRDRGTLCIDGTTNRCQQCRYRRSDIRTKKDPRDRSYQTHDTCDAIRSGSACEILQHRDGSRTALDDRSQKGSNDNAQRRRIRYL